VLLDQEANPVEQIEMIFSKLVPCIAGRIGAQGTIRGGRREEGGGGRWEVGGGRREGGGRGRHLGVFV
jgi:hypothetical protein